MDLCAGLSPWFRLMAFSGVLPMIGEKAGVGRRQQSQIAVPTRHRVFSGVSPDKIVKQALSFIPGRFETARR